MYNDYELLYLAQENNEDAVNELSKEYLSLFRQKCLGEAGPIAQSLCPRPLD